MKVEPDSMHRYDTNSSTDDTEDKLVKNMEKQFNSIDTILLMNGAKYFKKNSSKLIKIIDLYFFTFSLLITIDMIAASVIHFKSENLFTSISITFNYTFAFINIVTMKIRGKRMKGIFYGIHNLFDEKSKRNSRQLSHVLCFIFFTLGSIYFAFYAAIFSVSRSKKLSTYCFFGLESDVFSSIFYFAFYTYGSSIRQNWLIASMSFYLYFVYSIDQLDNQLTELNIITFTNSSNCNNFMLFKKAIVGRLTVNQIRRRIETAINFLPFLWLSFLFLQFNNVITRIMKFGIVINTSEIISYSSNFTFLLLFLYLVNYIENRSKDKTNELKAIVVGLIYRTSSDYDCSDPDCSDSNKPSRGKVINQQKTHKCTEYQKLFLNELNQPQVQYTGFDVFTIEKSLMIIFTGVVANYTTLFLQLK